jgi:hypothetical protein
MVVVRSMQPIVRRSALQCPLLESFWFWKAIGFGKLVVLECYWYWNVIVLESYRATRGLECRVIALAPHVLGI